MRWISVLLISGMVTLCEAPAAATGPEGLADGESKLLTDGVDDAQARRTDGESVCAERIRIRLFEPEAGPDDATAATDVVISDDFGLGLFDGPPPEDYIGGRGLITTELVTGMFLNPTSGTLSKGTFSAQYCVALLRANNDTTVGHGGMLAYGVTDDLEVGVGGLLVDPAGQDTLLGAGGPFVRLRLLNDKGYVPEVSIGVITRFGRSALERQTVFVAASKRFPIDEEGFVRSLRPHIGFRQLWQDSDVNEANGSIFYIGGEIEFPFDLFFVSEVSNKDDVFMHTPYSFGMQWRPNEAFGFSLAGIQNGGLDRISWYIGIGVDF